MNSICDLIEIIDINRSCLQAFTSFNVLNLSIRSILGNNFDELCLSLNEIKAKLSVIVLSETSIFSDENHPILEGYTSYAVCRSCNKNNRGGDLLVYVLHKLSSIKVEGVSKNFSCFVIYICGIYRAPCSKTTDFNREFFEMTNNILRKKKCLILDEFDVNLMSQNSVVCCQNFYDFFFNF